MVGWWRGRRDDPKASRLAADLIHESQEALVEMRAHLAFSRAVEDQAGGMRASSSAQAKLPRTISNTVYASPSVLSISESIAPGDRDSTESSVTSRMPCCSAGGGQRRFRASLRPHRRGPGLSRGGRLITHDSSCAARAAARRTATPGAPGARSGSRSGPADPLRPQPHGRRALLLPMDRA